MTKIRRYTIPSAAVLAVAAGLGLATAPAQAAAIVQYFNGSTFGAAPLTLTQLFTSGALIEVDEDGNGTFDKRFSNWKNDLNTPFTSTLSDGVTVTGFGSALSAGLQYDLTNFSKTGTGSFGLNATFSYKAESINPGAFKISGVKLDLTNATATGGLSNGAAVNDMYSTFAPPDNNVVKSSTLPSVLSDSTSGPLVSQVDVMSQLNLFAVGSGSKTVEIKQFKQTFSQVVIPEPGTVAGLLVAGGLGLAMKRKQQG
ncbi:PEP-CTERM sorting domain-containing protein [Microcystis aeruginosa]|jgi:hypothetical protein|uniref:PEP-CTERM sorting domain-containing protein n=1 Tax=Microcystis aeruginosa TaxID=1126 RepID=UPI0007765D5E|nr:PEP-CTERM sorting domain-containing protein [Microcystis aeruginosa]KXS90575.1 hypothetical protein OA58_14540 [Microcystis aeruginosa NIES-88]BCU09585.1 hypothetical protein MAN88_01490 [Microcystis aeruginosa]